MNQGNLPLPYLNSILDVYGHILQKSPNYNDNAASKVKQEILHGLGNASLQSEEIVIIIIMILVAIACR